MLPDTITLAIEEKYTPEEKAEIAQQLATAIADRETIKVEKSESDAVFNGRLKTCDAQISEFAKRYNKGCEVAQIGCDIRYNDPEPGKKSYYRMDRGELVETHEMNWEEKQGEIQFNIPQTETPEVTAGADELSKLVGDTTVCAHPSVSNVEGVWKCDKCGEVLAEPPIATPENPFEVGQQPPPEDFDQSNAAGA